ncbi:hypothetical protein GDO81_000359 [Engystomops pustulosus]|uniref:phosphoribosylaminoimidazolesuccinocarboxamide synthase n=1 Tax=Engystomops pustulosus TaxID=76066 RepID=A0AAV7D3J0_ENGPU|nr:hypothetical protein GDO81_000359 [Engystomops pustulosus]
MQRIKEEPVDADAIQSSSQEQYPKYLADNEIMQENYLEPEIGVDTSFRIVSVCSTRDANGWSDHGGLNEWSADSTSHQGKEHQVPSNKLISDHPRPFHVDTNSGIQAMERAQNLSLQECVKFQSIRRRYKPQMLQMQRRFTEDSIFIRPSKRRCTTTPRKFREVCKDIICLPADYPEHNCTYSVPRGNQREQLAMLGLVGKISIQSSCSFENFRRKVMTLFQKCFSCSEEEFSFDFLQCLPGNRKLIKPKVSATFKWSGTAIISLAAQGSLYIKTPHTLTESPKYLTCFTIIGYDFGTLSNIQNLFFNTKQHPVPEVKSENLDEKFSLGQRSVEPGDPHLMGSLCQVDEKDPQRCGIADFGAPQEHTPAHPSDEKQPNTEKRLAEKLDQGATEKMPTGSIPQEIPTIQYHNDGKSFNMTNNSVFKLLRNAGMKTAHVKTFSQKRLVTSGCETIPIAWGCWRIATGAYLRRHPGTKGRRLYPPRVEVFYMVDDVSEQVCSDEQLQALKLICAGVTIDQCEIDILNRTVVAMFEILEKACSASDFILANIKVQFGVDVESREIVLADVIEYNCWHRSQLGNWNPQDDKQRAMYLKSCTHTEIVDSISKVKERLIVVDGAPVRGFPWIQ